MKSKLKFKRILEAYKLIQERQLSTPLREHPRASAYFNAKILVKHEDYNWGGAFKIRGSAFYIWKNLPFLRKKEGIICATRGNFGIGVILASKSYNLRPYVVVPKNNIIEKNQLLKSYGANLIEYGQDYDEAKEYAQRLSEENNWFFLSTADDPDIIYGAATVALEIYMQYTDSIDYLIVPIGSGSLVSGCLLVRNALNASTKVIGVEPEKANATYLSWKNGKLTNIDSCETIADGLATRSTFSLPFEMIQSYIDKIFLVSENEIRNALRLVLNLTGHIVEPASATVFAVLEKYRDMFRNKNVAVIFTGKNISKTLLKEIVYNEH